MENMENDPYWDFIQEKWDGIQKAYNMWLCELLWGRGLVGWLVSGLVGG